MKARPKRRVLTDRRPISRPISQYQMRSSYAAMEVTRMQPYGAASTWAAATLRAFDLVEGYCLDAPHLIPAGSVIRRESEHVVDCSLRWVFR
jgi:hypothetical protein